MTANKEKKTTKKVATKKTGGETPKKRVKKKKILFVTSEAVPFAHTGGLGEVASSLPKALNQQSDMPIDCRVIMPLYESIDVKWRKKMKFLGSKDIFLSWRQKYMGVFSLRHEGVTYYFIDNEYYFKRQGLYGHGDDCERFAYFSKAVFEAIEFTGFEPDIIHSNDWQGALVPVYQRAVYKREFLKSVFTIHNVEYQGRYGMDVVGDIIDLPESELPLVAFEDGVDLMKGGIESANVFSTVSPTYAEELKFPQNAFGLDGIIRRNEYKMRGILNGIDIESYNPETDKAIPHHFNAEDLSGKAACKKALQQQLGLPESDGPLLTMITRLVAPKGLDIVTPTLDAILDNSDAQFVLLGTGDQAYEDFFRGLQYRHPDKVVSMIMFDSAKSRELYAAADIFVMPSRSEACGLAQMMSCRYGTVPVVHGVGGLKDSIKDCTLGDGNGFVFSDFSADSFYNTMMGAIDRYHDRENWTKLMVHDMKEDFSWDNAAKEYIHMYESMY